MNRERIVQLTEALDGPTGKAARQELGELLHEVQPKVLRLCRRYVGNEQSAEELAQDALVTTYALLPEYRPENSLDAWVMGIARNHCRNAIRRRREALTEDGVLEANSEESPVIALLLWEEREELIRTAAASVLTPIEQEIVHLRYVEQLSQDAITELLELESVSGARGVLQRCRRKLARAIRAQLIEMGHGSSFVRKYPTE